MAILFASSVRWTNEQGIDVILRLKNLKAYDVETERIPNRALYELFSGMHGSLISVIIWTLKENNVWPNFHDDDMIGPSWKHLKKVRPRQDAQAQCTNPVQTSLLMA